MCFGFWEAKVQELAFYRLARLTILVENNITYTPSIHVLLKIEIGGKKEEKYEIHFIKMN